MSLGQGYWDDMDCEEYNKRMRPKELKKSILGEQPNVRPLGKVIVTNKCIHVVRGKHEHC